MLIEDDFSIKENEATAPTEAEITDHGDIFKEELVLLKIGEILQSQHSGKNPTATYVKVMPSSLLQSDGGVFINMIMVGTFTIGSRVL